MECQVAARMNEVPLLVLRMKFVPGVLVRKKHFIS